MELLLNKIRSLSQYQQLLSQVRANGKQFPGLGLPRAARLPLLAALLSDLKGQPILLITDRSDHALSLYDELSFWVKSPRYHFAEPNPLFYEQAAWGVTTRRERLQTLMALAAYHLPFTQKPDVPPIFVASARSLMTRTIPRRDFLKACRKLTAGQNAQPDALARSWVEIHGDVQVRITPLTDRDATEMVRGIKGYRLLSGYRGHPSADIEAIEDVLLRVSRLVEEIPAISELDLNPVFVLPPGQGCQIADARIMVRPMGS